MSSLKLSAIFILLSLITVILPKISLSQSFPCGSNASYTINIPDNNSSVHLSENSVAVHPLNPNIVLSANNYNGSPHNNISAYVSTNWGVNWSSQYSSGVFDSDGFSDPAAGIDLNGNLYVAYMDNDGIAVAKSTNFGTNWILGSVYVGVRDKPHMHIDNSCNSDYEGRIYSAWYGGSGPHTLFSYSTNSGSSWSSPTQLSTSSPGLGVNIATDNSGNIFVVWPASLPSWNVLKFKKSTNGGSTWGSIIDIALDNTSNGSGGPSMSVNMLNDEIYIIYSGGSNENIYLKKSTNGGNNWSESRVDQSSSGDQVLPWLSCDPATGYLACVYYDARNGSGFETYLSLSTNSGNNWCDMKVSTNSNGSPGVTAGNDYIGVAFNKGIAYSVWTAKVGDNNYRTYTYPFEVVQKNLTLREVTLTSQIVQSANTISSQDVTIGSGANVTFRTVESITLLPGFTMSAGSTFTAELFYCEGYSEEDNFLNSVIITSERQQLAVEFSLYQNYPNPFNPSTRIQYSLKENVNVKITIFDILGRRIKTLVNEYQDAGYRSVIWDGTNNYGSAVATGLYIYKIEAGNFVDSKKMLLLK